MIADEEIEFDAPPEVRTSFKLRHYQDECLAKIAQCWIEFSRLLIVLATGGGKTVIFSKETAIEVNKGGRVLILAHTDELLEQAIDKLYRSTGIVADKEKAEHVASSQAMVVVASIQTLSRPNRLTGFRDDHFALVIVDEAHRCLAPIYQRVMNYFHFGKESLAEGWVPPVPGVPYQHKARVLGVTATADRGDKRTLGEFFQKCAFEYGLLEACRDGYLVRPIVKNIPIQIDLKRHSPDEKIVTGGDYSAGFLTQRITPFLRSIAEAISVEAANRKTVAFLPSVETAKLLAEALRDFGMDADFVSGACMDRDDKIAAFRTKPKGSVLCNAMLLVEGWDQDDVDCVAPLRVTKIRSLLAQMVGRGTRTLTGVIDGLETSEERLAAIEASPKSRLLILDFLWNADRLDLVKPVDLVASSPEIKKIIEASGETDLILAEETAKRDLLKALELAAKKNAKKKARTIDPLAWAVSLGDAALAGWEPESPWDNLPPTKGQLDMLEQNGIDIKQISARGLASKLLDRLFSRMKLKLCTPKQLSFLIQLGMDEHEASLMSSKDASARIGAIMERKKAQRV